MDSTNIDVTHGDSGSAVFYPINSPSDYRALGVTCQALITVNVFQRFTSETSGFLSAESQFPNDQ
jgi:allophanate hydrolase subunit 1